MKLLIVVNVDWFFLSHRLPIALAALQQGHEVHLATGLTQDKARLEAYGFQVHPLQVDRSGAGPVGLLRLWVDLLHFFGACGQMCCIWSRSSRCCWVV